MTTVPIRPKFRMTAEQTAEAERKTRLRALHAKLVNAGVRSRGATLKLSERCEPRTLSGKIHRVSTTGAFVIVTVQGHGQWHVPIDEIEEVTSW